MEPVIAVTSPLELLLYGVTQHPRVALKQCSISAPTLILKHLVGQPILAAAAFQAALFSPRTPRFPQQETLSQKSSFAPVNATYLPPSAAKAQKCLGTLGTRACSILPDSSKALHLWPSNKINQLGRGEPKGLLLA